MNPLLWQIPADLPVRLFFAVRPDAGASATIAKLGERLRQAHRLKGRAIARDRLHSTLLPVSGSLPLEEAVARAKQAAGRILHRHFRLRLEWSQGFDCGQVRYPLVLGGGDGLSPLTALRQELAATMRQAGFAVPQSFTPHVTLLWADRCVEENPIAPVEWQVTDFVLTLSLEGLSRHIHLGRWPLD